MSIPLHATAQGVDIGILPPAVGVAEIYASDRRSGLALSGIDPVSYRLGPGPRPGSAEHELIWSGLVWRFVSAANRAAFLREPVRFLPRIGGYDATAGAAGRLAEPDARLFAIVGGGLYLFRTAESRARFLSDPAMPAAAEARWPGLRASLVRG